MKLNNRFIFLLSLLLILLAILLGNTQLALAVSLIIAIMAFFNRETGLLVLIVFITTRPFLIELNPGLKITGDLIILSLLLWTFYSNRKNLRSLFRFELFEWTLFLYCAVGIISALITGVEIPAIIIQMRAYVLFYLIYYVIKRMHLSEIFKFKIVSVTFIMGIILSIHGSSKKCLVRLCSCLKYGSNIVILKQTLSVYMDY